MLNVIGILLNESYTIYTLGTLTILLALLVIISYIFIVLLWRASVYEDSDSALRGLHRGLNFLYLLVFGFSVVIVGHFIILMSKSARQTLKKTYTQTKEK